MSKKIYDIVDTNGALVGVVNEDLSIVIGHQEKQCSSILEILFLIENKNYHLNDMKGDLYTLKVHNSYIENIQKYGIGCIIK